MKYTLFTLSAFVLAFPLLAQDPLPVKTQVVRGGDEPVKIVADVSGVAALFLAASNGGDDYHYDQAVWCEPKLFTADGKEIDLTAVDYAVAKFGWGDVRKRGVKVGPRAFDKAWYAHAPSVLKFNIAKHNAVRFEAWVGIEGASGKNGSAEFIVAAAEPQGLGKEPMTEMAFVEQVDMPPTANVPIAEAAVAFSPEGAKALLARGVRELLFVRRFTLTSSHVYTEFVDARWNPGGSLCLLDLESGAVKELTPEEMRKGVINRFDLSWDARRVVFDYKGGPREPYCIYEIGIDGSGLRQLTFPVPDAEALLNRYGIRPDDMHPCYLQDGSIIFASSRCMSSVLCDSGDGFRTTTLHRMGADGQDIRPLSFNTLCEFSPSVLPDGRVLYMRWEYNRKGAGEIKCLWSMRPDGSGTAEVYGNQVEDPETMLYGRPIPGSDKISFLGCSHWGPNNAVGTIIVLDPKADTASTNAMRFVTPDVMAMTHGGFTFIVNGKRIDDNTGRIGRLFKDPYPLAEDLFVAAVKPKGIGWEIPNGYRLAVVDGDGRETPLFRDNGMSCWHPYPVLARQPPPMPGGHARDAALAQSGQAQCLVTDVYAGMDGVTRGDVKFLRVMEQTPRPWAARTVWGNTDTDGMAHSAVGTRILGLHVQHGTVPVEADGSANFLVPANRNIYFQALDADGRAIQTERTYVNYMPGEVRGCVGCHIRTTAGTDALTRGAALPAAMKRKPSALQPEAGHGTAAKTFDYECQVQPLLDKHCVTCHGGDKPAAGLTLDGTRTRVYSVSYEQLLKRNVIGRQANENDVRTGDTEYKPPYYYGAYSSILAAMFDPFTPRFAAFGDKAAAMDQRLAALRDKHKDIRLTPPEKRNLHAWLDPSCQYYPSYWGQKNLQFAASPHFRPAVTAPEALATHWPERLAELYQKK
jgi:hypothetical protein